VQELLSYSDKELAATRIVMIQEAGGADKSQCINSDRSQLEPSQQCTFTPTGKAATAIGGSTIFNAKSGWPHYASRPCKIQATARLCVLQELQHKNKYVRVVFFDENSMLYQEHLCWIDHCASRSRPTIVFWEE
jgi:hypothetical protein